MSTELSPPDGTGWRHPSQRRDAEGSKPSSLAVVVLVLLAAAVLCSVGFLVVRVLFFDSPPAPLPASVTQANLSATDAPGSQASSAPGGPGTVWLEVNPQQGYINTLVSVQGRGWWPGEAVFVFLRAQKDGEGPGFAYAAAVADQQGSIHTAFTFPNEMRWIGETRADVIARGTRSGREAATQFSLVAPTPTLTAPLPTARPTVIPSSTIWPTETYTPEPTPTPDMIISDWRGEYFDNPSLAGEPVYIRDDVAIDFNWGGGSPDPRLPDDRFSARWSRDQIFSGGFYRFTILSDDGVRFWFGGQILVDEWHDSNLVPYNVDLYVPAGTYSLWLEYYENLGGAMIRLTWNKIMPPTDTPAPTAIPTDTPLPTAEPTETPTATARPTDTATATPTLTDTPIPTHTATSTPSPTDTVTPTPTDTPTPTPTDTASPTTEPTDPS